MNKFLKFLTFFFGTIFFIFLFLSIRMMIQTQFLPVQNMDKTEGWEFHYAFFLPTADQSFFNMLREGALDAAKTMDCAISFHSIDSDSPSFEMARFSGVDGIGLYLYEKDNRQLDNIAKILSEGISIVQIENEVIQSSRSFFVGTNNFNVGKEIGRLAMLTEKDNLNMALIYSEKNPGVMSDGNLIEIGIKSVMGNLLLNLSTEETSLNPLDAESLTYDLLRKESVPDIIVLTDPNDTLVTVQAVVDMNLVGKVQIIGYGDNETIKAYINKGVILGSIVRNPYRIGFSTVMALKEISVNGYTSAYVDTGITILSEENL